jgi:hypothetical protein
MTKKIFIIVFSIFPLFVFCQKEDYVWRLGLFQGIDFNNNLQDTFSVNQLTEISYTNTSICDSIGNLLFYTNGVNIYNRVSDTMFNGDGLNPTNFTLMHSAIPISQADIAIKRPGYSNEYYIFHETWQTITNELTDILFLSKIDMTLDSGMGAVALKNQHFYENDTLQQGLLTAVRHANGEDWWLITRKKNPCIFYTWLIQSDTIQGPFQQTNLSGVIPGPFSGGGQVCFSPDGTTYAAMYMNKYLYVYDFDRCSGQLTNKYNYFFTDSSYYGLGCAFSASGRYLYVSTTYFIYQYDMYSSNIDSSKTIVAVYDGFQTPQPYFYTHFNQMRLAANGKIFISTDNGCDAMHVIEFPDSAGVGCNVMQHSFWFSYPSANVVSVPNIPSYTLGPLKTACDSSVSIEVEALLDFNKVYPNPNNGIFTIKFATKNHLQFILSIFDSSGRLIETRECIRKLNEESIDVDFHFLEKGIYFLNVKSSQFNNTVKLIID